MEEISDALFVREITFAMTFSDLESRECEFVDLSPNKGTKSIFYQGPVIESNLWRWSRLLFTLSSALSPRFTMTPSRFDTNGKWWETLLSLRQTMNFSL